MSPQPRGTRGRGEKLRIVGILGGVREPFWARICESGPRICESSVLGVQTVREMYFSLYAPHSTLHRSLYSRQTTDCSLLRYEVHTVQTVQSYGAYRVPVQS